MSTNFGQITAPSTRLPDASNVEVKSYLVADGGRLLLEWTGISGDFGDFWQLGESKSTGTIRYSICTYEYIGVILNRVRDVSSNNSQQQIIQTRYQFKTQC